MAPILIHRDMPSKILVRLISEALLPAVLLVVAKVVGVLVLLQAFSIAWELNTSSLLPDFVLANKDATMFINSYSNLIVFIVVILGLAWVLTKAYHFHDTHIKPSFILQLLSWNLTGLMASSEEIYHKGVVWVSYMWLTVVLIGVHTYMKANYLWVFAFVFVAAVVASWYFIADVEREVEGK